MKTSILTKNLLPVSSLSVWLVAVPICSLSFGTGKTFSESMNTELPNCQRCKQPVKKPDRKYCSRKCATIGHVIPNRYQGNAPTVQQTKLYRALRRAGLSPILEYMVLSGVSYKNSFRLKTNYKIDIAFPDSRLAVEVDGNTHRGQRGRLRDAKKLYVLRSQGWTVFRVTNKQVDINAAECARQIQRVITERIGVTK